MLFDTNSIYWGEIVLNLTKICMDVTLWLSGLLTPASCKLEIFHLLLKYVILLDYFMEYNQKI